MSTTEETGPLLVPPAPFVEDTDTKSIRIAVAHPPLPEQVPVASVLDDVPRLIPKRPNVFQRIGRALVS